MKANRSPHTKSTPVVQTVSSKNTGRIVNQSVSSPLRARIESSPPKSPFIQKIEKREVKPEKVQEHPLLKYNFKVKSKNEITPIVAMPLGPEGKVTSWNPDGLSTKELLKKKYDEGKQNSYATVFGYFYTPHVPLSPEGAPLKRQIFVVKKGFDIAVGIAKRNEDRTISVGRFQPYTALAPKLDTIVNRLVKDHTCSEEIARHRVGGDIIRVGSGDPILGKYREEEWPDLAEFAMIIRADKARAPGSTRYCIDDKVREYKTSFKARYGEGVNSLYEGAPKGGAKKIKERQVDFISLPDASRTDTRSDTRPD